MTELMFDTIENGGVASACGFSAGGIHAGFRGDPNRLDMALVEADELCPAAGVFTQNVFCSCHGIAGTLRGAWFWLGACSGG